MSAFSFGTFISVSVFLKPLEADFGWSRGETSLAYSVGALLTGVGGILMGRLVDRISPRPLVLLGAVMVGASQLLLSRIGELWQLYLVYGLAAGMLGNGAIFAPVMANVGFWFERHKGLAIGLTMMGQSLGSAGVPYLARGLLERMDWREAYVVLGLLAWAVLIPAALLIRQAPGLAAAKAASRANAAAPGPVSPALLTASLCAAIVFCCTCMSIPIVHVYPLAVERGFPTATAASLLALFMAASAFGRVGTGKVADHIGGLRTLWLASALQTAAIYGFVALTGLPALYAVAALFGLGYGGVLPSYAIVVREQIPAHRVGRSLGLVFFFGEIGMATGGWLGGALYDWSGAYRASFGAGALAGLVNLAIVAALMWRMGPSRVPMGVTTYARAASD
jgi:MFS family permease